MNTMSMKIISFVEKSKWPIDFTEEPFSCCKTTASLLLKVLSVFSFSLLQCYVVWDTVLRSKGEYQTNFISSFANII